MASQTAKFTTKWACARALAHCARGIALPMMPETQVPQLELTGLLGRAQKGLIGPKMNQNGSGFDQNGSSGRNGWNRSPGANAQRILTIQLKMGNFRHISHTDYLFCWIVSGVLIKRAREQRKQATHTTRPRLKYLTPVGVALRP